MIDMDPESRAESLSFQQLKLFESVGRLSSVRQASEECNLSQPAVTQSLAKLEQLTGVVLLDRRASGSYLNALGEILYRRTTRLFEQLEDALITLGVPGAPGAAGAIARRITRSQARSLIAIVESRSFARAAETLGVAQASLQRAARDLESNLKRPLYYRTAAGVMVTSAGVEFGRRIKLATQEIEWAMQEIETAQGGLVRQIAIGAMPFGGSVLLAKVLDEFVHANPKVDVKILNENAWEILKRLRDGEVDFVIGLVQETTGDDLVNEALAHTPYAVVARRGHRLAKQRSVSVQDLLNYEWVVGTAGASRRACFERLFQGGPTPQMSIATSALPVIRHLLVGSDRLTLMTSYELMHENELTPLAFGPIEPIPAMGVTMRSGWLPTKLHHDFIELLRRHTSDATTPAVLRKAG
jgi:DNA-binding transcriptional LysR family regulator